MADTRIKLLQLANVHYQHPNLDESNSFFLDFGFHPVEKTSNRIYYRGYGKDPYCYLAEQSTTGKKEFVGGSFIVDSFQELEKASKVPGATPIHTAEGPGAGDTVIVTDPNGYAVKLLYGQKVLEPLEHMTKPRYNTAEVKERVGEFHRYPLGPCKVHKLGHYGFMVPKSKFLSTRAWYLETFNFAITDSVYSPETGEDELSFMHIDLGETFTDHHGVFVGTEGGKEDVSPKVHHSSFEVHDLDTQNIGHQHLKDAGWTSAWGVGRHFLGSQIFDYWFDPSGFIVEHYADGDLVNSKTLATREVATKNSLYVWGPEVPKAFLSADVEDFKKKDPAAAVKKEGRFSVKA